MERWYWISVAKEALSRAWQLAVADKRHVAFTALSTAVAAVFVAYLLFGKRAGIDAMQALVSAAIAAVVVWLVLYFYYLLKIPAERAAQQKKRISELETEIEALKAGRPVDEIKELEKQAANARLQTAELELRRARNRSYE